MDQASLLGIQR